MSSGLVSLSTTPQPLPGAKALTATSTEVSVSAISWIEISKPLEGCVPWKTQTNDRRVKSISGTGGFWLVFREYRFPDGSPIITVVDHQVLLKWIPAVPEFQHRQKANGGRLRWS